MSDNAIKEAMQYEKKFEATISSFQLTGTTKRACATTIQMF